MTSACPLYDPQMEHESCGVGAVIDLRAQATHRTVSDALTIVERLAHRAGSDATGTTGDGVGILTRLPHALFARWRRRRAFSLGGEGEYAVGMFFLPDDGDRRGQRAPHLRFAGGGGGALCALLARRALPPGAAGRRGAARHAPHPPVLPRPPAGRRPPGKRSTAASTSSAASLKSSRPAPTSAPSPAAPSSTRA